MIKLILFNMLVYYLCFLFHEMSVHINNLTSNVLSPKNRKSNLPGSFLGKVCFPPKQKNLEIGRPELGYWLCDDINVAGSSLLILDGGLVFWVFRWFLCFLASHEEYGEERLGVICIRTANISHGPLTTF